MKCIESCAWIGFVVFIFVYNCIFRIVIHVHGHIGISIKIIFEATFSNHASAIKNAALTIERVRQFDHCLWKRVNVSHDHGNRRKELVARGFPSKNNVISGRKFLKVENDAKQNRVTEIETIIVQFSCIKIKIKFLLIINS